MTSVTVIIPTYNRAEKTLRAISSVLSQTFQDLKVILVDDGSTDDTLEKVKNFKDRITYIRHKKNLGVSAARNTGIRSAESRFIAFLDSDDYWLPDKLKVQVPYLEQHPDIPACQAQEIWVRNGTRVNPRRKHLKPSGEIFLPSLKQCMVSPSAVMMKKSLFEEIGLFDEKMPACEDYDLWLRITYKYRIDLIDQFLLVKTGGHSDQLSARYDGMDRFRIYSMAKLVLENELSERYLEETLRELTHKCLIYGNGCLKRGKKEEAEYYLNLPNLLKKGTATLQLP